MKGFTVSLLILILSGSRAVAADSPYVREGSIGTQPAVKETSQKGPSSFRPIEAWVGERFIFLPQTKGMQEFGYQNFGENVEGSGSQYGVPYNKYCGRIARVLTVKEAIYTSWDVIFQMEDDGQKIRAWSSIGILDKIAPVADIDDARAKWKGKVLWYAGTKLDTYNADKAEFGHITIKKYYPVRVVDIVAGWYNFRPVRFIVRTPALTEGFADVCWSGTNGNLDGRDFESLFLQTDPRKTHNWSGEVWSAIEDEKVFVGMTAEQALMSWGKPVRSNRSTSTSGATEVWDYPSNASLYLKDGAVTSIYQ